MSREAFEQPKITIDTERRCVRIVFRACEALVWPVASYLETMFADGTFVPSTPNRDEDSLARAERLGYGDDTHRMSLHHELTHTWYSEQCAKDCSPTLWAVAHKQKTPYKLMYYEEETVLALQAYVNDREKNWYWLTPVPYQTGKSVEQVKDELRAFYEELDAAMREVRDLDA